MIRPAATGSESCSAGEVLPRTLADLGPGQEGVVTGVHGDELLRVRLMELGFLPGGRVRLVRRAPLGCPLEVDLDGTRWSLRLDVARGVRLAGHE